MNLWNDVDALTRLALMEQAAEEESRSSCAVRMAFPTSATLPFPERNEFEIHALNTPAGVVTGDYFDLFFVDKDLLSLVVADVSGKGIPAALLMAVARSVVRNVSTCSTSPADTLTRVNRILYRARLDTMFLTIFLGWYDIKSGMLKYANAGHPVPYRIGKCGQVEAFGEVTGPILGILDVDCYAEREDRLAVDERLVLYTDGVTEARSPEGDFFGTEKLTHLLTRYAAEPVDRLCERVLRDIDDYQGPRRQDDATLLALRRKS